MKYFNTVGDKIKFYSKKDDGTGLGLAITHSIIENHGGKISVESKIGVGTIVRMELPLNREKTRNSTQKNAK